MVHIFNKMMDMKKFTTQLQPAKWPSYEIQNLNAADMIDQAASWHAIACSS
jgi:hypothetical protein